MKVFKLKDNINIKELEQFGFRVFTDLQDKYLIAVRNCPNTNDISSPCRIGVDENNRIFNKSKFRGNNKCLLNLKVKKEDIQDLIDLDMIEKI